MTFNKWLWFFGLLALGVLTRWVPHPPNFSALLAIALFGGFLLPGPAALALPVLSAFLGDAVLGFHDLVWVVYLTLLAMVFIGRLLPRLNRGWKTWGAWAIGGLGGSVLFFATTNFGVWWASGIYPHTHAGFMSCYLMAIPFFHNTILSTWVFLFAMAGVHQLATATQKTRDESWSN